jgi:hypothetical protein
VEDGLLSEWWDGEWWSPYLKYAFNLITEDRRGYATVTNAPRIFQPGDCTVKIDRIDRHGFSGEGMFTNGRWYKIRIRRISENEFDWSPAWSNGIGIVRMSRRRPAAHVEEGESDTHSQDAGMSGWNRRVFNSPGLTQVPPGPHLAKLASRWESHLP